MAQVQRDKREITSFDLNKAITFSKLFNKIKLSPTARLVLRCLADFWNPSKGLVYPGQRTIAECTGASENSITNAVNELRENNLILTAKKGIHLNYYFTNTFFDLLEIGENIPKNWGGTTPKIGVTCIEQKREQIKNRNFNFEKATTPSQQATKSLLENMENDRKNKKSPYDDKETAIIWLKSICDSDLKHKFIYDRVEKVRKIWGL